MNQAFSFNMINFKVSEIINYLKNVISKDFILTKVKIEGEISNFKSHASGNKYFSLKEDDFKIDSVIFQWKNIEIPDDLKDGIYVICSGAINVTKDGKIQYTINEVEKFGQGKLYEQFIELKNRLEKNGYFDLSHKRKLPYFPTKIGVITSSTGAAIKDIITVTKRRNKATDILIYPSLVQGNDSVKNLIEGLDYLEKTDVDLVILGRGGGSYEDLNSFNSEELAMRIFNFSKPIISAVGHEIDFVISDFIADVRAATPSAAAEIAVLNLDDYFSNVEQIINRVDAIVARQLEIENLNLAKNKIRLDGISVENTIENILIKNSSKIKQAMYKLESKVDKNKLQLATFKNLLESVKYLSLVENEYQKINTIKNKLNDLVRKKIELENDKLNKINNSITTLNIKKMLNDGYALVSSMENKIITKTSSVQVGEKLKIILSDGELTVNVLEKGLNK